MKRVLVSVSDKTNLVPFVTKLVELGYEVISTGGTKKALENAGLKVLGISEVTGAPEILGGRVKTLHPKVHGGLLAIRNNEVHINEVKENNIEYIDMVVVNLYPFKETVSKPNCEFKDAVENIDIGGPSMLRSAAKNHEFVTVVCDSNDYDKIINEIEENGNTTLETRRALAAKVFRHTASYDAYIAEYFTNYVGCENPEKVTITFDLKQPLRYGENPHQEANFYVGDKVGYSIANGVQLHGKELSYNNIQDANAALQIIKEFNEPCVVALKHMNPCGVGVGKDLFEAWTKAYESDPVSIFGGIVCTNQVVDKETALKMKEIFLEIIIAPDFTEEALNILTKKKNIRLMKTEMNAINKPIKQYVSVNGGLLVQNLDLGMVDVADLKVVTKVAPTEEQLKDLMFAGKVVKHVKSNAIALAKDQMTVGVGAGQMNRVGSAHIALEWAREHNVCDNICLASDAFFPFDDVVKMAKDYGVTAIIQPGGSVRDEDSIKACDEYGIAMVFTGMRHFKH